MYVERFVDTTAQRLLDHVGLLEDLLEHEVLEAAFLGRGCVPRDLAHLALDRLAVERGERIAIAAHLDHLALFEHDHLARVLQHRGDIGSDEHLVVADADDQRRCTVAREDQAIGRVGGDDAEGKGAVDFGERVAHGGDQIAVVLPFDQVREHLGVGFAGKPMALGDELCAQGGIVFDDPVVHHGERRRTIQVRVRVLIGGTPVRRPACVADADVTVQRFAVREPLSESRKLALGLRPEQRAVIVDDGDPGRVVPAILQAPEGVHDDRDAVTPPDVPDDAAHGESGFGRPRATPT